MNSLRFSQTLGRSIRQDLPENLGKPTRKLVEEELNSGHWLSARELLQYLFQEHRIIREINSVFSWSICRFILDRREGGGWDSLVRKTMAPWIGTTAGLKGHPVAEVAVEGPHTRLTFPDSPPEFHLVTKEDRYEIGLGPPEQHPARWERRHQEIAGAIDARKPEEALQGIESQLREELLVHDVYGDWNWALFSWICRTWGEEILGHVLKVTQEPWLNARYERIEKMNVEEAVQLAVEGMRGHFSGPGRLGQMTVSEERDRYVLSFDPCGSGGRMRRGDPVWGSGSRLEAPYHFVVIQGAYPWTWGRKNVCGYCAHCAVALQILPIERTGFPLRVTHYPDDPKDPCQWMIYKQRDSIPEEAYTSVGKIRP